MSSSNYGRVRKRSNRVQTGYDNKFSLFLFYFILFYFILFYFILFYFILFYFILFYFILFLLVCLLLIYFRVKNVKIIIGMTHP